MKQHWIIALVGLLLCSQATIAQTLSLEGLTPEKKGLVIAQELDRRDHGFGNFTAEMKMVLRNRKGEESERYIVNKTLEMPGDGDRSLSIFNEPPDIKGTVSLTHSHGLEPDDQWLFLPELKRVKRVNSKNKSGPFMGSEFAFEDIGSQEVEKYTYLYLRDEKHDGIDCYVNQRTPAYEYSGYTRQEAWIDKQRYIPLKILFYDRKNTLLKTLVFKNYKQYLNQYWRASEMYVENHQTEKSTTLYWSNFQFKTDLDQHDFEPNALKRMR